MRLPDFIEDLKSWPCVVFWIFLGVLFSYWTWTTQLNDFGGDSAIYLLTAQHWSVVAVPNPAAAQFASASIYPPMYPLLLAAFSAGDNWLVAHQVTVFCGVATLFVLWRCMRLAGFRLGESLTVVAVLSAIPGFYWQALYIHSELLFLFFVSICLYAVQLLERETKLAFVVIASLAAAGAYLTRSIGLSLVTALVVYFILNRPKREWPVVLILAVGPVLGWAQFGQSVSKGYFAQWSARLELVGSSDFSRVIGIQIASLWDGYIQNIAGPGSESSLGATILFLGCVATWAVRLWQRKLDALFLGAYLAILLVWPFPAERIRFLMPAIPVLLLQLLLTLHEAKFMSVSEYERIGVRVALAILAITGLPSILLAVHRQFEPMPEELAVFRQSPEWHGTGNREARLTAVFQYQRWYAGFEQLNIQVPINECVYSIKPAIVGLLAKRSSFHTPLPNTRLGEKLEPEDAKCRYVHMVAFSSPTYSEPFYPLSRWINEITVLNTTHYIANDDRSTVVSLIAKTR